MTSAFNQLALPLTLTLLLHATSLAADWPQWRGPGRDGLCNETGIVENLAAPTLEPRWTAPIGAGYSGPTVAAGRVYVMDRLTQPSEVERIHCLDWETGRSLWTRSYECRYRIEFPSGPRTSVTIVDGHGYALGAIGHLVGLHAESGNVLWSRDLSNEYELALPRWGLAASPLVCGDVVIVMIGGADGACVVGFDRRSGTEKWRALDDPASYASPILVRQAGRDVVICWTGAHVAGLDPETGRIYWKQPYHPSRMVINIATPVVHGDSLFLTDFFAGSFMFRMRQEALDVESLWHRSGKNEHKTDALHSLMCTPQLRDGHIYGVDSYGQLRCLDATTGNRIWEDTTAVPEARWANVHMVRNGERTWLFNELGELIVARMSSQGYQELGRSKLIEPSGDRVGEREAVCWSHPAFAYRHVFARNDGTLVCASLEAK